MFIATLSPDQMSRLVHLFWKMGNSSMFGQIFSEIDQTSTLRLLTNIKPSIADKIPSKFRSGIIESAEPAPLSHANVKLHQTAVGSGIVPSSSRQDAAKQNVQLLDLKKLLLDLAQRVDEVMLTLSVLLVVEASQQLLNIHRSQQSGHHGSRINKAHKASIPF